MDGLPLAVNPNVVEPAAASGPFQAALVTVTADPLVATVPFQTEPIDWPLARVHPTDQPAMAALPAVTVTCPWKPPCHELTMV